MTALRTVADYDRLNALAVVLICTEGKEQYGGLVIQKNSNGLWAVPGNRIEHNTEAMVSNLPKDSVGYLLHVGIVPELLDEFMEFLAKSTKPVPDGQ